MNDTQLSNSPDARDLPEAPHLINLAALWKAKWYIAICVVAAVACGTVYLRYTAPIYDVTARVLVKQERLSVTEDRPLRHDARFLATQAEIIRSPLIVRRSLRSPESPFPDEMRDEAIDEILAYLQVTPLEGTSVIKIGFRDATPDNAVWLVESLIESYEQYTKESQPGTFSETLRLVMRREDKMRTRLEEAEQAYQTLRNQSPWVGQGKEAIALHLSMVRQLGDKLSDARNHRVDLENQLAAKNWLPQPHLAWEAISMVAYTAPQSTDDSNGQVEENVDPASRNRSEQLVPKKRENPQFGERLLGDASPGAGDLDGLRNQLWDAKTRAKELEQIYGAKHPELCAVREQITMWEELIRESEKAESDAIVLEYAAAKGTEGHLSELYDGELEKVKNLDVYLVEEEQARENIQRFQDLHKAALAKLSEWEITNQSIEEGQVIVTVRVLDGEQLMPLKIWPRVSLLFCVCIMIGLAVGVIPVMVTTARSDGRSRQA